MKIFVASWFYPPVTTSEALVTYKLFSNSKHEYYVCSASSKQWSYNSDTELKEETNYNYIEKDFINKRVKGELEINFNFCIIISNPFIVYITTKKSKFQ